MSEELFGSQLKKVMEKTFKGLHNFRTAQGGKGAPEAWPKIMEPLNHFSIAFLFESQTIPHSNIFSIVKIIFSIVKTIIKYFYV